MSEKISTCKDFEIPQPNEQQYEFPRYLSVVCRLKALIPPHV
jgi:hypothetical protein